MPRRQVSYVVRRRRVRGVTQRLLAMWVALTTVLACGLSVAMSYFVASRAADVRLGPGRYQPVLVNEFGGGRDEGLAAPPFVKGNKLVLVDTATGRCWALDGGRWHQLGNPAAKESWEPKD